MATENTQQNDGLTWKEAESGEGAKYEIGRTEFELTAKAKAEEADGDGKQLFGLFEGKKPFDVRVRWTPGEDKFVVASQDVLDTASIASYNLTTSAFRYLGGWSYSLEFTNTKNYNYFFYDETGDYYQVNCYLTGNHSVKFNSEKPTIVRITGS
ncbi:hypothetical protein FDECE_9226 [Fusarium decemcellulare]|nr:hypothetical protein FDECE_9226 [Fusarium decemcellulare]